MSRPKQQTNSQSQSCTSCFGEPNGLLGRASAEQLQSLLAQKDIAAAIAALVKSVQVETEVDDCSNAQGQGQICQADFSNLAAVATLTSIGPLNNVK